MSDYDPTQKHLYHYYVDLGLDDDFDFLGEDGKPIFMDYRTVDWKALGQGLRDLMDGLPKSVSVYVANEPMDVSDSNTQKDDPTGGETMSRHLTEAFADLEPKDYRAGVFNLAQYRDRLHPVQFPQDQAPPAIGIFIAIKATMGQMTDYETTICHPFGHLPVVQTSMMVASHGEAPRKLCVDSMDPALHQLLVEHLGLPYKRQCNMMYLHRKPA